MDKERKEIIAKLKVEIQGCQNLAMKYPIHSERLARISTLLRQAADMLSLDARTVEACAKVCDERAVERRRLNEHADEVKSQKDVQFIEALAIEDEKAASDIRALSPEEHTQGRSAPVSWAGDWTEDYVLENGQYFNNCIHCGQQFCGHKRRVVCRVCASKGAAPHTQGRGMPSEAARYFQMGLAMVESHNMFDGKSEGQWVEAKNYDTLRQFAEEAAMDAERYRWLCADLPTEDERDRRDNLFRRMSMMSESAINEYVDAALQSREEGK